MISAISAQSVPTTENPWKYFLPGPYETLTAQDKHTFFNDSKSNVVVKITSTLPVILREGNGRFPTIILFNGFKMKASFYASYRVHLASWGYVVLQYDIPLLKYLQDTVELACLEDLLDEWLAVQNVTPGSPLWGMIDMGRLGLVGHSRGGKLAALHFARSNRFRGAFLIDPVDNTSDAPESPTCPNAAKALRASGKQVGIMGAGIVGHCNPEGSNYQEFYEAAGEGSWLAVVNNCGHQQFLDAGFILNRAFDLLCRGGKDSRQEVAQLTKTPLVAWLDHTVRGPKEPCRSAAKEEAEVRAPLDAFFAWAEKEQAAGMITFSIKPIEEAGPNSVANFHRKAKEVVA